MIRLTDKLLHSAATGGEGWNRDQLELLGVSWPATKGWLSGLVGKDVPADVWAKVVALRGSKPNARPRILASFEWPYSGLNGVSPPPHPSAQQRQIAVSLTESEAQDLWVALDALHIARTIDMDKKDAERWKNLRDKFRH